MSSPPNTPPSLAAAYASQLDEKTQLTRQEFSRYDLKQLDVFPSPPQGYRMRAEFRLWHQDGRLAYVMFRQGSKHDKYEVTEYSPGSMKIQQLMPQLLAQVRLDEHLKTRLFQVDFLTTTSGEALISLLYHRPLDASWESAATALAQNLGCHIIGRSRKQKIVIGLDYVIETVDLANQRLRYQQVENSFTQPNGFIARDMLSWVIDNTPYDSRDLLELYCGNGNFSLALAPRFDRILATEISKSSIRSAQFNCKLNEVNNIEFVRLSSEELTQALNRQRAFRRLSHIDLDSFDFSTVLVDPPRAGLDHATLDLIKRFDRIVYISCNPGTLHSNLEQLVKTHQLDQVALFDQFPFTPHRECGVILNKR